ncbi:MAG TPA: TRAP transporter permease [Sediminispirochaeta sp.]|nr:TRAP transporter permease [Sediminispirochaeta sp.]
MSEELEINEGSREALKIAEEAEFGIRHIEGKLAFLIPVIAAAWSIFQLSLATVFILDSVVIRAVHLAFAISLVYLSRPLFKKPKKGRLGAYLSAQDRITTLDIVLALVAAVAALYVVIDYQGLSTRPGSLIPRDIVVGLVLVVFVLEAARRALGPVLPIVAGVFIAYSFLGPYMPGVIAFKGVSLGRFINQITISTQGIYGIPLDVSATIVFLFVLFGSMLDQAGAGRYFVQLAFSLMGRFKGGPAKAAVLASGLTGMVSGSSIANVVTTGTFTIPMMKKVGYPAHKAGAVEVACSTNGQLMPPVMGAAAFIIAEYANVEYLAVVKAAFIPAVVSYIALMYITHLEAGKLGLKGLTKDQIPPFWSTFIGGVYYIIPILFLIYELVIMRRSPQLAVFRAITALAALVVVKNFIEAYSHGRSMKQAAIDSILLLWRSLVAGGRGMMGIGVAVAAAGIIVGVVTLGLGGIITEVIEVLSGGNFILILFITAFACLLLGMGLPTTANYIVMASLTAPVIVTLGAKAGVVFPLIAAHLFVFFFGILADDTPPVGLAAFAASAIAKSNPIKTGIQGFTYDIRTALLPFMFIFNTDLLLVDVHAGWRIAWIFFTTLIAMFAFAATTQNFFVTRNRWYESILLLLTTFILLRPYYTTNFLGIDESYRYVVSIFALFVYGGVFMLQNGRKRRVPQPAA